MLQFSDQQLGLRRIQEHANQREGSSGIPHGSIQHLQSRPVLWRGRRNFQYNLWPAAKGSRSAAAAICVEDSLLRNGSANFSAKTSQPGRNAFARKETIRLRRPPAPLREFAKEA